MQVLAGHSPGLTEIDYLSLRYVRQDPPHAAASDSDSYNISQTQQLSSHAKWNWHGPSFYVSKKLQLTRRSAHVFCPVANSQRRSHGGKRRAYSMQASSHCQFWNPQKNFI